MYFWQKKYILILSNTFDWHFINVFCNNQNMLITTNVGDIYYFKKYISIELKSIYVDQIQFGKYICLLLKLC